MREIVVSELAAFPILQPLLTGLVTANLEAPDFARNAFEILVAIDPDAAVV